MGAAARALAYGLGRFAPGAAVGGAIGFSIGTSTRDLAILGGVLVAGYIAIKEG